MALPPAEVTLPEVQISQYTKIFPETERAKRCAQCGFVDMSVLQRFMLRQVRYIVYNFAKGMSGGVNIKKGEKLMEICIEIDSV